MSIISKQRYRNAHKLLCQTIRIMTIFVCNPLLKYLEVSGIQTATPDYLYQKGLSRTNADSNINWCGLWDNDGFGPGEREYNAKVLESWCQSLDIFNGVPSVCIKDGAPGRGFGLYATRNIEPGEILATVPKEMVLGSERVPPLLEGQLTEVAKQLWDSQLKCELHSSTETELSPPMKLALNLIYHRSLGCSSDFVAYLNSLPRAFNELPAFWPDHKLEWLKGSLVYKDCILLRERLLKEFTLLKDLVQSHIDPDFSLKDWCWARASVLSRAYSVGGGYLLCPFLDMGNHDDDVKFAVLGSNGEFVEQGATLFVSERSYSEGDEVLSSYGNILNWQKLFSFGYTEGDGNSPPNGATEIMVLLDENDIFFKEKSFFLDQMKRQKKMTNEIFFKAELMQQTCEKQCLQNKDKLLSKGKNAQDQELEQFLMQSLPAARLCTLDAKASNDLFLRKQTDSLEVFQSNIILEKIGTSFSQKNEGDAMNLLVNICQKKMKVLSETLNKVVNEEHCHQESALSSVNVCVGEIEVLKMILKKLEQLN